MAEPVESGADEDASKASNTGEKKDERTQFYELDFNELNRDRTPEERRRVCPKFCVNAEMRCK